MEAKEAWTFQQDWANIANSVHRLLYGQPLVAVRRADKRLEPQSAPRQVSQERLWTEFFVALLNGPLLTAGQSAESAAYLQGQREALQAYRTSVTGQLRNLLAKQTVRLLEKQQ